MAPPPATPPSVPRANGPRHEEEPAAVPDGTGAAGETAGAEEAEALEAVLQGSVGVPFSQGNRVEVLEDERVLRRLAEDLRGAQRSITFQVYYIESGRTLNEFAAILSERARAGVRVFLLLDALGTKRLSSKDVRRLVGEGVRVARLRPARIRHPRRFLHRAHSRSCVIDGTVAYTGGFGLADKWDPAPGEGPAWRDIAVRVDGPAALHLQSVFTALWAEAQGGEVLKESELFPAAAVEGSGTVTAGVLFSRASETVSGAIRLVDVLASVAKRRLWVYSGYFAPGPEQRRLLESAARRGVDVRVLTAGPETDLPVVRWAGRGTYPRLLEAGVRIWEFRPRMLHAKALVVDDQLGIVGSLNVDPVSWKRNDETALLVLGGGFGDALAGMFAADLEASSEMSIEELRRQPLRTRVLEKACGFLPRIL